MTTHYEGQQLAEFDLKLRGPGELFSTLQHGHFYFDEKSIILAKSIIQDLSKAKYNLQKLIINHSSLTSIN